MCAISPIAVKKSSRFPKLFWRQFCWCSVARPPTDLTSAVMDSGNVMVAYYLQHTHNIDER